MVKRLCAGLTKQFKHQRTPGGKERAGAPRVQHERRTVTVAQAVAEGIIGVDVVLSNPNRHGGETRLRAKFRVDVADLGCKLEYRREDCVVVGLLIAGGVKVR